MTRRNRIELTINTRYLPEWGVWEGVRELYQNAADANLDGYTFKLGYDERNGTLVFCNQGAQLSREALLLGTTTKNGAHAGQFGEGLKLGVLALVRAGKKVTIQTGDEFWEAKLAKSAKFDSEVLCFDIKTAPGKGIESTVTVIVENLREWPELRKRFLAIDNPTMHKYYAGNLILDRPGDIYVKGIWVANDPKLSYGYELPYAQIDRDRKMLSASDLTYYITAIWADACHEFPNEFNKLLDAQAKDIEELRWVSYPKITARVYADFVTEHGPNAYPCENMAQAAELEHYGVRGVLVNPTKAAVLARAVGLHEAIKQRLSNEATKTYTLPSLSPSESEALLFAVDTYTAATGEKVLMSEVDVVDYRTPELMGQFHHDTGRISIARKVLANQWDALHVIIHEASHRKGKDGEKSHVYAMELAWKAVCKYLYEGNK